ncbi:hypothetical protein [Nocardia farcinica]|uniref:hypothetical protein n=1 Tax=Nocardia farcinica TaxID=37329 RepID=UPI0024551DA8|nr:hypothetical protein [Nocardia farcinica]
MQNITIGRYRDNESLATRVRCDAEGVEISREEFKAHAGWIEGVRDDGTRWVMFLDAQGSPQTFWARREPDGAVTGPMIDLEP